MTARAPRSAADDMTLAELLWRARRPGHVVSAEVDVDTDTVGQSDAREYRMVGVIIEDKVVLASFTTDSDGILRDLSPYEDGPWSAVQRVIAARDR